MDANITDVTIVGGGDSGLLAGLSLRRTNPELDVRIVDDFERDIPQVGKSTYHKITDILHEFLGIDEERFMSEVKPVWKGSVYFRDWCGRGPFHFPFDNAAKFPEDHTPRALEHEYHYYETLYDSPDHRSKGEEIVEQRASPMYYAPESGTYRKYRHVAYHLNTERFNSFLRDLCRERDVSLVDDEITDVAATGDRIERVESDTATYESDLYVDASGFNRVLKRAVDDGFREFDLPLDSAFNTRVDRPLSEVVPATVIESGEHGWFWEIDTFDNRDFGYVFSTEHVSDDEARAAFLDHVGGSATVEDVGSVTAEDVAKYEFTSGFYEDCWTGNCLAIGNAEGFVEPLQSTGLTTNAWAAMTLADHISAHGGVNDRAAREAYNAWVRRIWESIHDFVSVHYLFAEGEGAFWDAAGSIEATPRVKRLVEAFDDRGFSTAVDPLEGTGMEDLLAFTPLNFYVMLRNLGVESAFYEIHDFEVSSEVKDAADAFYESVREEVEDHLTTEEVYRGIPDLASAD
ncbi:MAG: tryptophan 7-halogenase [Halobacteriales archaeon]